MRSGKFVITVTARNVNSKELFNYVKMDESTAIAKSLGQGGMRGLLEVFVDIGGGTADMAIRHENQFSGSRQFEDRGK